MTTTTTHGDDENRFHVQWGEEWETLTPDHVTALRERHGEEADWWPPCDYCEGDEPRPSTVARTCGDCSMPTAACAECALARQPDDFTMARMAKMIPVLSDLTAQLTNVDHQIAVLQHQRTETMEAMATQAFDMMWPMVAKADDSKLRLDDDSVVLMHNGREGLRLSRSVVPGGDIDGVKRSLLRAFIGALFAGADGLTKAFSTLAEEARPSILVQCDDHGPLDPEHVSAVAGQVQNGSTEEIAAANERLRKCARPARAFRKGDQVDIFVHNHHDCGEAPPP